MWAVHFRTVSAKEGSFRATPNGKREKRNPDIVSATLITLIAGQFDDFQMRGQPVRGGVVDRN